MEEDSEKSEIFKRYSEGVPEKIVLDVYDFLAFRKMNVMVAPFESDAQMACLFYDNRVDYIVSEDSDMFAYGCFKLIKSLKSDGNCLMMNLIDNPSSCKIIRSILALGYLIRYTRPT